MEPQAFVAEVYRRMSDRSINSRTSVSNTIEELSKSRNVINMAHNFRHILPNDKSAAILDIGFGSGWFIAATLSLGYKNIYGAEYGIDRQHIYEWSTSVKKLYNVESSIGDFLADKPESFDFIHMSHVIEHIPKYHLLYVVDAIYRALRKGGILFLRTPNMEGPCALSSLFVTLGHEYGFTGSNIKSLMELCNFDELTFHTLLPTKINVKQRIGFLIRNPFIRWNSIMHRLFGVNTGGVFGKEINISGKRLNRPPLFDTKFR